MFCRGDFFVYQGIYPSRTRNKSHVPCLRRCMVMLCHHACPCYVCHAVDGALPFAGVSRNWCRYWMNKGNPATLATQGTIECSTCDRLADGMLLIRELAMSIPRAACLLRWHDHVFAPVLIHISCILARISFSRVFHVFSPSQLRRVAIERQHNSLPVIEYNRLPSWWMGIFGVHDVHRARRTHYIQVIFMSYSIPYHVCDYY